jgi:2'-5' RNA ligase
MAEKRLFIGTFVKRELFDEKYMDLHDEFSAACSGKWVEPSNLHFTYSFLGEVDENLVPDIKESLRDFLGHYKSELVINGLGVFPNPRSPRVLHAEVYNPDKKVFDAQKNISDILKQFGFEPEDRKYTPHVTLCRIKTFRNPAFNDLLDSYRNFNFGKMEGFDINIIESRLRPEGPVYLPLH